MKIELQGVLKSYRSLRALDHVSLTIEPGQIVSLLGPNGAGKTTLIRCLTGIAAPDKGVIRLDEQEFHRNRLDLRRRIHFFERLDAQAHAVKNIPGVLAVFIHAAQRTLREVVA